MHGYGMIASAFAKIQDPDRATPAVFNHEYLRYTMGFGRESDRAFIPLMKRIGILEPDGKPTPLYERIRNPKTAAAAFAEAMQIGYPMLFAARPDAATIDRKVLAELVHTATGLEVGHTSLRAIVGTFLSLRELAAPKAEVPRADDRRKTEERRRRV
jgi:hypothetical protein